MIIAGSIQKFAIVAKVERTAPGWIWGSFKFVFQGRDCGNWNDAASLGGCCGWLKDFAEKHVNRFEPGLFELPPIDVFERLVCSVIVQENRPCSLAVYERTYSRFHITHLGSSSFDQITMVLMESSEFQRCVWSESKENGFHDYIFPAGHMQEVALDFCRRFEQQVAALSV